jgi:hypothetical protein
MEYEPARAQAPIGKRLGGRPQVFEFSVLRSWMVKLPRRSPRLEPGWAREGWGARPPPSALDAQSDWLKEPGLNPVEPYRLAGFDSYRICWLVAHQVEHSSDSREVGVQVLPSQPSPGLTSDRPGLDGGVAQTVRAPRS